MNGPISIPVDELNKLRDEWALAIGRFLVAFTSCEYWTYLYIGTFGSERLREAVTDMNLGRRIEIAHALVTDLGLNEAPQARVDAAFEKLRKLSRPRNVVAHNGPMVRVYSNPETGALELRHETRSARDPTAGATLWRGPAATESRRENFPTGPMSRFRRSTVPGIRRLTVRFCSAGHSSSPIPTRTDPPCL